MVPNHLTEWLGYPVEEWTSESGAPDFGKKVFRLRFAPPRRPAKAGLFRRKKEAAENVFESFISHPRVEATPGLSLCSMSDFGGDIAQDILQLVGVKEKFPALRALFLGELTQEECEISWINQGNVTPVLESFPGLEDLRIRGGNDLVFGKTRHICLKKLVIETGGLTAEDTLPGIHSSIFPELEHLEIWTGTDDYGWDGDAESLRPFLYDNPFPKLKYLGLRNSSSENEIAQLAADAPVLDQLETLDLSLGTLQDSGAEALLASERVKGLKKLDLHYHFLSEDMMAQLGKLPCEVAVSGREYADGYDGETYYYVAVGE